MSTQELIQKHLEKCKECKIKNCDGIHVTQNNKTRCDKDDR